MMHREYLFVELNGIFAGDPSGSSTNDFLSLVTWISSIGWKNFIRAVSLASPMVGEVSQSIFVLSFT